MDDNDNDKKTQSKSKSSVDNDDDDFSFSSAPKFVDTSYSSRNNARTFSQKLNTNNHLIDISIAASNDYAQKKFGNAKSISSDQYFGLEEERRKKASEENASRIAKFSGANSISSDQFFGNETSSNNSGDDFDFSAMTDNLTDGVKKVFFSVVK